MEKLWLNVPYAEKDAAKRLGVKWDSKTRRWYAPDLLVLDLAQKWDPDEGLGKSYTHEWREFEQRPPRTPKQCLSDLDAVVETTRYAFCPMCDSMVHEDWVFDGKNCLHHRESSENRHQKPSKIFLQRVEYTNLKNALNKRELDNELKRLTNPRGNRFFHKIFSFLDRF